MLRLCAILVLTGLCLSSAALAQMGADPLGVPQQSQADALTLGEDADRASQAMTPSAQAPLFGGEDLLAQGCCRYCTRGCACGNSCINCGYTCRQPPGCACNR